MVHLDNTELVSVGHQREGLAIKLEGKEII